MMLAVVDQVPDQWWCECSDRRRPHVHCPWGGMHTHLVDPETGLSVEDGS